MGVETPKLSNALPRTSCARMARPAPGGPGAKERNALPPTGAAATLLFLDEGESADMHVPAMYRPGHTVPTPTRGQGKASAQPAPRGSSALGNSRRGRGMGEGARGNQSQPFSATPSAASGAYGSAYDAKHGSGRFQSGGAARWGERGERGATVTGGTHGRGLHAPRARPRTQGTSSALGYTSGSRSSGRTARDGVTGRGGSIRPASRASSRTSRGGHSQRGRDSSAEGENRAAASASARPQHATARARRLARTFFRGITSKPPGEEPSSSSSEEEEEQGMGPASSPAARPASSPLSRVGEALPPPASRSTRSPLPTLSSSSLLAADREMEELKQSIRFGRPDPDSRRPFTPASSADWAHRGFYVARREHEQARRAAAQQEWEERARNESEEQSTRDAVTRFETKLARARADKHRTDNVMYTGMRAGQGPDPAAVCMQKRIISTTGLIVPRPVPSRSEVHSRSMRPLMPLPRKQRSRGSSGRAHSMSLASVGSASGSSQREGGSSRAATPQSDAYHAHRVHGSRWNGTPRHLTTSHSRPESHRKVSFDLSPGGDASRRRGQSATGVRPYRARGKAAAPVAEGVAGWIEEDLGGESPSAADPHAAPMDSAEEAIPSLRKAVPAHDPPRPREVRTPKYTRPKPGDRVLDTTAERAPSVSESDPGWKELLVAHFGEVRDIEPTGAGSGPLSDGSSVVGGVSRFAAKLRSFSLMQPLLLFSGDAFFGGRTAKLAGTAHMSMALNLLGVHTALYGNRDLEQGEDALMAAAEATHCAWLLGNVWVRAAASGGGLGGDNEPGAGVRRQRRAAGARRSRLFTWAGVKVGVVGLVDRTWLQSLNGVDPAQLAYMDFVEAGQELVGSLRQAGAEVVIALTHMSERHDVDLVAAVPGIDLVLCAHAYGHHQRTAHGVPIIESGSNFEEFTLIRLRVPATDPSDQRSELARRLARAEAGAEGAGEDRAPAVVDVRRVQVTADVAPDPPLQRLVDEHQAAVAGRERETIAHLHAPLDARNAVLRRSECGAGNLLADAALLATDADAAILNAGIVDGNRVVGPGPLTLADVSELLPRNNGLAVVELTAREIHRILEVGCAAYPAPSGRFPLLAGLSCALLPNKSPMSRIPRGRVRDARGSRLDARTRFRVCVTAHMARGRGGFDFLAAAPMLQGPAHVPQLDDALLFTIDLMAVLDAHAEDIIGLGDEDTVDYLVEQGVEEHDAAAAIKLRQMTGHRSHYTVDYRAEGRVANELELAHEVGM